MALIDGLVAYYKYSEASGTAIADSTPNGNTGYTTGTWTTGYIGNGISLAGSGTVSAPIAVGNALAGSFTYSFYFNKTKSIGFFLMHCWSSGAKNIYIGSNNNGSIDFYRGNGGASQDSPLSVAAGTMTTSTGVWQHIIISQDGLVKKIYAEVGGVMKLIGQQTSTLSGGTTGQVIDIFEAAGGVGVMNGKGDESGFWNRALTDGGISVGSNAGGEISELHTALAGGISYPFGTSNTTNFFQFIN